MDLRRLLVDSRSAGQRLDRFLVAQGDLGSRARLQRHIAAGGVRVDGLVAKAAGILRSGQVVEIAPLPTIEVSTLAPQEIPLSVMFEDAALLVLNKPAGLVVHPAPGNWQGTLANGLLHHLGGACAGLDALRPGIVHRLDKDTSGVLVVAKDAATLTNLAAQFHDRLVEKQYIAIVWGRITKDRGIICEPIGRNPVQRKQMAVRAGGRVAETAFEVVERLSEVTIVRLLPKTGRTHQLRVHLAALGHPIVGDATYGRARRSSLVFGRQALHAQSIKFRHPGTAEMVSFSAPLPPDMCSLLDRCRGHSSEGCRAVRG